MTLLMTIILDGEKLTPSKFLGVLFGLSGVLLVISQGHITTLLHLKIDIGDLIDIIRGFWILLSKCSILARLCKKCHAFTKQRLFL